MEIEAGIIVAMMKAVVKLEVEEVVVVVVVRKNNNAHIL
jgi:hypothetical protein